MQLGIVIEGYEAIHRACRQERIEERRSMLQPHQCQLIGQHSKGLPFFFRFISFVTAVPDFSDFSFFLLRNSEHHIVTLYAYDRHDILCCLMPKIIIPWSIVMNDASDA